MSTDILLGWTLTVLRIHQQTKDGRGNLSLMRLEISTDRRGPQRRIWHMPDAPVWTYASGGYVFAASEGEP